MTTLNIGTFNVNGCRCTRKRAALFDYLRLKQADVILLQETHTDQQNQAQWYGDWKGSVVLSHGTNLSAGVAILFSPRVSIQPDVVEIIPGRILRVDMVFGNTNFSFINVYAPNVGQERISFLKHCLMLYYSVLREMLLYLVEILIVLLIHIWIEIMTNLTILLLRV